LVTCLLVGCYLIYKRRSRRGVVGLSIFSLLYFGFYRRGCICPIGSPQNVVLGLVDPAYAVPVVVVFFFLLPLVFALFAGRVFCGTVCPHGALQDVLLIKPVRLPLWLEQGLSVIPYLYLGAGIYFAYTGAAFIICRYDPFVPFFRLSGGLVMLLLGAGLAVASMFIGRPYCRFFCPYGALLRLAALVSKWRVRITPDFCSTCRLCADACPFGAIREPLPDPVAPDELAGARRAFGVSLLLLPLLVAGGAIMGHGIAGPAAVVHPTVALAERYLDPNKPAPPRVATPESLALQRAEQERESLLIEAVRIKRRFDTAGWWFGGWVGLVIGVRLVSLTLRPRRAEFEADRGACFACARCYLSCPNERVRLGLMSSGELSGYAERPAGTEAAELARNSRGRA
ncbi:MAG: 4Fe-4S binding protein, partial [Verrucomicrobiae bacterium]|nr:4Fe-4S binding protein [Verrucomicrobiae bacterium]